MCLSKYSNLEHLREVASNLYSTEDHENINELCEKELAALINTFYQESDVATLGEKRKNEHETSANKKLRVSNKVFDVLSALELLPNEVYEMILKYLGGEEMKNIRITSKGLYNKTTLMAPMFNDWSFDANWGTQPEFVLWDEKNFNIKELRKSSDVDPTSYLNRLAHRISSIKLSKKGLLKHHLEENPAKFSNLTSLDLEHVSFNTYYSNNKVLFVLAPQLENLRLSKMLNTVFDISCVTEDSKCFTKLKTLKLFDIKIDLTKILSKCCKTLEYLELSPLKMSYCLEDFEQEFSSLKHLSIIIDFKNFEEPLRNLLSKCSESLRTLKIEFNSDLNIDFSTLLEQSMKITTLEIQTHLTSTQSNIEGFLDKCPLLQNLTLHRYKLEVNGIILKDLTNLKLDLCGAKCMTSILKQVSECSLTTVNIKQKYDVILDCEFPVITKLDTLLLLISYFSAELRHKQAFDKVVKLFPTDAQVNTERLKAKSVSRRVFNLH